MGQTKKAKSQVFGVIALFLAVLAVILSLFGVFNTPINVNAGYVKEFNFQGRLTNPDGTNVADGTYDMIFRIYNVPSDGIVLWKEYHTGGNKVTVEDGVFNVNLGSINEINLNFNSGVYYLGIEVNGDGEMTPRRRIGGTGYSLNTERVYGVPGSLTDTNIDTFPEAERGILDALNYLNTTAIPAAGMWADSGGNLHPKATVSQDVSIPDGRLHVSGAVSFDSTLGVTGATTLSSTLLVSGAASFSSTLGVTSTTTLSGTLNANGIVNLGDGGDTIAISGTSVGITSNGANNITITSGGEIYFSDQRITTQIPFSLTDNTAAFEAAFPAADRGIVDALVSLAGGSAGLWNLTGTIIHPAVLTNDVAIGANSLVAPFSVDESLNTVRIGEGSGGTATNAILNMYASNDSTGAITYTTNDLWEFSGGNIFANGGLVGIGSGANGMPTTGRSLNIYNAANDGYGIYTALAGAGTSSIGQYVTVTGAAASNFGFYSTVSGASEGNFAGYFVSSLAATPTSPAYGVEIRVTSDGSAGFDQGALNVILGGDYSGGNPTYGVAAQNLATGSGLNIGGGFYSLGGGATNYGVYGSANGASATNAGGYFTATSAATTNYGVYSVVSGATHNTYGIYSTASGAGVHNVSFYGQATLASASNGAYGFYQATTATGNNVGQYGIYNVMTGAVEGGPVTAIALYSTNTKTSAGLQASFYGIYGAATGSNSHASSANFGVRGDASGATTNYAGLFVGTGGTTSYGVYGEGQDATTAFGGYFIVNDNDPTTAYALYASANGTNDNNYGIYATASGGTNNWAGYFVGNVHATGTITSGATITIDGTAGTTPDAIYSSEDLSVYAAAASDLSFGARGSALTAFNDDSNLILGGSVAGMSLIGAINALDAGTAGLWLDNVVGDYLYPNDTYSGNVAVDADGLNGYSISIGTTPTTGHSLDILNSADDGYGFSVSMTGGSMDVIGGYINVGGTAVNNYGLQISTSGASATNYGAWIDAESAGGTSAYAGHFEAYGAGDNNYALYATAYDGTNNYAAVFPEGYVGVGIDTPSYRFHFDDYSAASGLEYGAYFEFESGVTGPDGNATIMAINYSDSGIVDAVGVIGQTMGTRTGAEIGSNIGLYGIAGGSDGINIGVRGWSNNDEGENYGGYFDASRDNSNADHYGIYATAYNSQIFNSGGYFTVTGGSGISINYGIFTDVEGGQINEAFHGEATLSAESDVYGGYLTTTIGTDGDDTQSGFYSVISGTHDAAGTTATTYAIQGINETAAAGGSRVNGYGVYGSVTGANRNAYGVYGLATGSGINYGSWGSASGGDTNYGGSFTTSGGATTNIGIYGEATGAGTNYAGYLSAYGVGQTNYALWAITSSAGNNLSNYGIRAAAAGSTSLNQAGYFEATGAATTNKAIQGAASGSATTYGGQFSASATGTNSYGVYSEATDATNIYAGYFVASDNDPTTAYGLYTSASGTNVTNYGIYSVVSGGTTNWAGYFVGNVALGGSATAPELRLYEATGSGTNYTAFKATAQAADITYTLPSAVAGGSGYVLTGDATGAMSWTAPGTLGVALSSITAATATNSINSANYAQTWAWNSLTTETAMTMSSSSMTRGKILTISSDSTAGTATRDTMLLYLSRSGANANASHNAYGLYSTVTNTGTTSTNYGIYATASGATTNWAGYFVGDTYVSTKIGVAMTPTYPLDVTGAARISTSLGVNGVKPASNYGVYAYTAATAGRAVYGYAGGNSVSSNYGVYGYANADSTNSYGLYGVAAGTGSANYGIYATASGANDNYAGIFDAGYVGIGDTTPDYKVDFYDRTSNNQYGAYFDFQSTYSAGDDQAAIYAVNSSDGGAADIVAGVIGAANGDGGTSYNAGVFGWASSNTNQNIGVWGRAADGLGGTWGGYFEVLAAATGNQFGIQSYLWAGNDGKINRGADVQINLGSETYTEWDTDSAVSVSSVAVISGSADYANAHPEVSAGDFTVSLVKGYTLQRMGNGGLSSLRGTFYNIGTVSNASTVVGTVGQVSGDASGVYTGATTWVVGVIGAIHASDWTTPAPTYTGVNAIGVESLARNTNATGTNYGFYGTVANAAANYGIYLNVTGGGGTDYGMKIDLAGTPEYGIYVGSGATTDELYVDGTVDITSTLYMNNAATVYNDRDADLRYVGVNVGHSATYPLYVSGNAYISSGVLGVGVAPSANYAIYSSTTSANGNAVRGLASSSSAGTNYGGYFSASGAGVATSNVGVYATASGAGTTNYGIYATASQATTNWAGYFVGNVALGGSATAPELRIYEATGSGTNYTAFKATAQASNITYTLPSAVAGGSGYVLTGDATGALSWSTTPSVTVPLSSITAATATNSINNANYAQTWAWNSLTAETAMTMSSSSMTRGKILTISSTSTAGITDRDTTLLYLSRSGANDNANHRAYGLYSTVSNTGTTSTNYGIYAAASGATTNWAGYFDAGDVYIANSVGLNTTGPDSRLDILDASNPQLRLTYADGTSYTTFQSNSGGDLVINPYAGDEIIFGTSSPSNPVALIPAENNVSGYSIGTSAARWKTGYFVDGIVTGASSTTYAESSITRTTGGGLNVVLGGAAGDDFTVNTDTFVVESDHDYVGINKAAPGYALDVADATANGRGINVAETGTGTTYGIYSSASGATTDYGGYFTASGTRTNYGIYATASGSSGDDDIAGYFTAANLDGKYVVHIVNTENNSRSDVLALQLGYAAQPSKSNAFIQFMDFTGAHTGAVVGDGAGGVKYGTTGEDYAEYFPSAADWPAGTVVKLGANGKMEQAVYGDEPLGVISSHPGFSGGRDIPGNRPLAMMGQVPVKITNEGGAIRPGDKVTVSSRAGFAKKVQAESDPILGMAVESFSGAEGQVKIFVSLLSGVLSASASADGSLINGGLIEGDLGISGELDVAGTIKASSLWSQNATWHIDSLGEAVFQKVTAGDIEIIEGENKAIGRVILPGLQKEIFVPNNSVTSVSRIFLTIESANDASAGVKVKEKRPGQGFVISTIDGKNAPVDLPVDWLVIN